MILILSKRKCLEANIASNVEQTLVSKISDFEHYHAQNRKILLPS